MAQKEAETYKLTLGKNQKNKKLFGKKFRK